MDIVSIIFANRKFRIFLVALGGLIIIWLLFSFLTKGWLEISTNDENNLITLYQANEDGIAKSKEPYRSGTGKLSVHVSSGKYVVVVSSREASTKKTIEVSSRKKQKYEINVSGPQKAESVLPTGAFAINDTGSKLIYLDATTGSLLELGESGRPSLVDKSETYEEFFWSSKGGLGKTKSGKIYSYKNGELSQINLPGEAESKSLNLSVSPGGEVYISQGKDVYVEDEVGNFTKIYTAGSEAPKLFAGNKYLALLENSDSDKESKLVILDKAGKVAEKEVEAYEVSWSPDGEHLAVSGDEDNVIFDSNLRITNALIDGNVNGLAWLNNSELLYGVASVIWRFNLESSESVSLITSPTKGAISGIYPNEDYIYFNVAKDDKSSDYNLFRIGLNDVTNNFPDYLQSLYIFFPTVTDDGCSFSFTNYTSPTMVVGAPPSLESLCLEQLKNEFLADSLPLGSFKVVVKTSQTSND